MDEYRVLLVDDEEEIRTGISRKIDWAALGFTLVGEAENGLEALELAEALNVSRQAVSRWEVGTAVPALDNLVSLSGLYGVPLDYLVRDEMEQPPAEVEKAVPHKEKKPRSLVRRAALALCLIAVGALAATAALKLYDFHQVRKAVDRLEIVYFDDLPSPSFIITDNPEKFQQSPDGPRSYRLNPDGTYEEYSLLDEFRSMLDQSNSG